MADLLDMSLDELATELEAARAELALERAEVARLSDVVRLQSQMDLKRQDEVFHANERMGREGVRAQMLRALVVDLLAALTRSRATLENIGVPVTTAMGELMTRARQAIGRE